MPEVTDAVGKGLWLVIDGSDVHGPFVERIDAQLRAQALAFPVESVISLSLVLAAEGLLRSLKRLVDIKVPLAVAEALEEIKGSYTANEIESAYGEARALIASAEGTAP